MTLEELMEYNTQQQIKLEQQKKAEIERIKNANLNHSSDPIYWGYVDSSKKHLANQNYLVKTRIPQQQQLIPTPIPTPTVTFTDSNALWSSGFSRNKVIDDLLDDLFSLSEKIDFLYSIGYVFQDENSEVASPDSIMYKKIQHPSDYTTYYTVNEAFSQEMRTKFKNLLLSKQLLKLKI